MLLNSVFIILRIQRIKNTKIPEKILENYIILLLFIAGFRGVVDCG